MAHPYDDDEAFRPGERRGDRDRWGGESWDRPGGRHSDERDWRRADAWRGSERPSGWEDERYYRTQAGAMHDRGDRRSEEYSRAPYGRDERAMRDVREGGDLGWHGGVRGAEGGGGYGEGFFGTAYSLYAGRPEHERGGRLEREGWRGAEEHRIGRGPKGYRRSDDRIHDEVCERIARSGVNADDVEVKVENGEVTLTGSVARREDKWRLESICDSIFGVDDVHNQLRSNDRGRREPDVTRTH